ncbi:TPA: hypothetical protein I7775_21760 [Vibrio vulnificus]|nr:hypothetical protein [Vibrio vulnificus]
MKRFLLAVVLFCPLLANAENAPKIIEDGFVAYLSNGPKSAIEAWTKGSVLENSKSALAQANTFRQIEDFYGHYEDFEVYKKLEFTDRTHMYFIVAHYEKGAVFSKFSTYLNSDNKTVVSHLNFTTEAEKLWPESVIYGE